MFPGLSLFFGGGRFLFFGGVQVPVLAAQVPG
jgi:hypothetical protein